MVEYRDLIDGSTYPLTEPRWCSDAGRPLWIDAGSSLGRGEIDTSMRSLWRYRAALPLEIPTPISLGEGRTPLVPAEWSDGTRPLWKLEWFSPTGSFKDRGSSVMLSHLRDRGVTAVLEDSSGNGGSSVAAYGAAGGLGVTIFAPASTSPAKIAQVRAHGAHIQLVEGPRVEAQNAAIRRSGDSAFYASHNWQPWFLQGTKTLAYELWEDLGFRAPDAVVVPVGAGSALLGCYLGFRELWTAGQIARVPRLFAAQPVHCSPVDASFRAGTDQPVARPVRPTIAEGTSIAEPLRLAPMVHALRETGGTTVAVSEQDIARALDQLCRCGFFVEPTSAVAAAGCTRLLAAGTLKPEETTVVVLSGSGLKSATAAGDALATVRA